MAVVKEQIRQIISENNITSVADVYIPFQAVCVFLKFI